ATGEAAGRAHREPDPAADAAARIQRDEQGNIIPPDYRYFSFASPFAGNAREGSAMYSIELSVNVFMPPMFADVVILRLQENEMKLRGAVMDVLGDVAAEDLRDVPARADLVARIRDAMNALLVSEGYEPDIREVVITSFVIT
ncbi:MAG: flagellar basal body-associated FliL family protein, partial [Gemmobacter sp.]